MAYLSHYFFRWDISGWKRMNLKGAVKNLIIYDGDNDVVVKESYDRNGKVTSFRIGEFDYEISSLEFQTIDLKTNRVQTHHGFITEYDCYCVIHKGEFYYYFGGGQLQRTEYIDSLGPANNQYTEHEYNSQGLLTKTIVHGDRDLVPLVKSNDLGSSFGGYIGQTDTYFYQNGELAQHHLESILGEYTEMFSYEDFDVHGNWRIMRVRNSSSSKEEVYRRTITYY